MKQPITFDSKKLLDTLSESDRNFYATAANRGWAALRAGETVQLAGEYSETGWCLVFITIGGKEYQLTKKQLRTNDLKFYFQSGV
jgi:hypothetical protein